MQLLHPARGSMSAHRSVDSDRPGVLVKLGSAALLRITAVSVELLRRLMGLLRVEQLQPFHQVRCRALPRKVLALRAETAKRKRGFC